MVSAIALTKSCEDLSQVKCRATTSRDILYRLRGTISLNQHAHFSFLSVCVRVMWWWTLFPFPKVQYLEHPSIPGVHGFHLPSQYHPNLLSNNPSEEWSLSWVAHPNSEQVMYFGGDDMINGVSTSELLQSGTMIIQNSQWAGFSSCWHCWRSSSDAGEMEVMSP